MPSTFPNLTYRNEFDPQLGESVLSGVRAGEAMRQASEGIPEQMDQARVKAAGLENQERTLDLQAKQRALGQLTPGQLAVLQDAGNPFSGAYLEGNKTPFFELKKDADGNPIGEPQAPEDAQPVATLPGGRRVMFSPTLKASAMAYQRNLAQTPSKGMILKDANGQPMATEVINPDGTRSVHPIPRGGLPPAGGTVAKVDPNNLDAQHDIYWQGVQKRKAKLAAAIQSNDQLAISDAKEELASYQSLYQAHLQHLAKQQGNPDDFAEVEQKTDPNTGQPVTTVKRKVRTSQLDSVTHPAPVNTPAPPPAKPSLFQRMHQAVGVGRFASEPDEFGYIPNKSTFVKEGKTWTYIGNDKWQPQ